MKNINFWMAIISICGIGSQLQAKTYGIDSPRPCIAEKACEVDNPHWNNSITKVSVTYRDEMQNTHRWTKMINSDEGVKDCDVAAKSFPYRFETCSKAQESI